MELISLPFADGQLNIQNFNNDFLLIQAGNDLSLATIGKAIYAQQFDFVREVIVTETEICLQLQPHFRTHRLAELADLSEVATSEKRRFLLPVYFLEHEDWAAITQHTGLAKFTIIKQLCNLDFSVAQFGFLPGFLYLNGLPTNLQVPRKTTPAKYVAANSLAIGGPYLGAYAVPSPGGWYVVGSTPLPLLRTQALPPSPFELGDQIRLVAIDEQEFNLLQNNPPSITEYNG